MRRAPVGRLLPAFLVLVVGLTLAGAPAGAAPAPRGPQLSVSRAEAAKALACVGPIDRRHRPPILLLHGTTSNPTADWSWNWGRYLRQRGWGYCALALPDSGNADIQVAAEYVVRAIRAMSARAGGRRIDVLGHSQGGMIGRWALKFWPDTRAKVDDVVGLASSNHGTQVFDLQCGLGFCSAANWQQRTRSAFIAALNRGPDTFPGISYTQVATAVDEIVVPATSAHLTPPRGRGARLVTNTSVQSLCPLEVVDHFGMSYSHGAWLIAMDALTHRGPARLDRLRRQARDGGPGCGPLLMPGVDPLHFPLDVAAALAQTGVSSLTTPQLPAEPALRRYAR